MYFIHSKINLVWLGHYLSAIFSFQDKIPLLAIVNYPTVALNPRLLDYQTVSLYQHQTMKVILTNHSPFPIEYNFSWSADEWEVSYAKYDDKFVKVSSA